MGNDGGSIPRRRELVREAARAPTVSELKATALESLSHAWTHDPLSSEPLDFDNTASDWRGRLYSYESVLKGLIPRAEADGEEPEEEERTHGNDVTFSSTGIRSLRDVVRLRFKRYRPAGPKEREIWACPVSLKELGPATRAVYIVPCGHVFAEVAIKEITDVEHVCPECSAPFEDRDVVPILPTEDAEMEKLRKRIEDLHTLGLTHSLKHDKSLKKKKRKNGDKESGEAKEHKNGNKEASHHHHDKGAKVSKSDVPSISNTMTASLTAKVMAEQGERNKRRKLASANA